MPIDTGAESFALRGGAVRELLTELGLDRRIAAPAERPSWLALRDRIVPMPALGVLGIPASPLADDVRAVLDWPGALRAYCDRVLPRCASAAMSGSGRSCVRGWVLGCSIAS